MNYAKEDFQPTTGITKADFEAPKSDGQSQTPAPSRADFAPQPSVEPQATRLPAGLHPNVQTAIDQAANERGIPVWALRAIGRMETGGQAHPETAVSPAGAVGAMQMLPSTFQSVSKGNILNLTDNVKAGATYYQTLLKKYGDPIKAAGAYNAGPGAFDAYLAGKGTLTHETLNYMAQVAAMHTPIDETPLPPRVSRSDFGSAPSPAKLPQKRLPTQARSNLDPEKARYEWYDQLFGHQDLPFILDNAKLADEIMPGAGYTEKALHLYAKNPAAAAAEYGDNARGMLLMQAELSDEQVKTEPILAGHRTAARAMLANPALAAGATALEEFFNPMSWVEGAGVGKGLGLAASALNASRLGRMALHFASPYREIVAQHGENARNLLWQMGARMAQGSKLAKKATDDFFGNLTQAEQWEVVRRSQGSVPNPAHAESPDIMRRAVALRQHIVDLSLQKVAGGVLKPSQIKDTNLYFPMRGTAENPLYNAETMSFLDAVRPNVKYSPTGPSAESLHHAKYDTVDQAVARTEAPLDPTKTNAATQFYKFVKASHENLAFEKGLRDMAAAHPDMIRFGTMQGSHLLGPSPTDRFGREMVNVAQALGGTPSPGLQKAWVSRELGQFLTRGKAAGAITGWSDDAAIRGTMNVIEKMNQAQRAFIIANPGFHPFWNIAPNTSGATDAGLFETMRNYGRAIVGTAFSVGDFAKMLPGAAGGASKAVLDAAEKQFWIGSQAYAHDLADAIAAGAEAHFGHGMKSTLGGDAVRLRTLAKSELTGPEKLDRFLADLGDWNSHATFGERGEGQFVATLFKNRVARGLAPEDAAWQVRQALGHYQNVDPNSWQSKYIMFYPWLKSNVPHWLMNFLQNPKLARAQVTSFHRQNEETGDPRANDAMNRRNPSQLYLGRDAQGREMTWAPPFPWKDAEKAGEILAPGPRDLTSRLQVGEEIIASRLKSAPSIIANTFGTVVDQTAHNRGDYAGYQAMFDKNDSTKDQIKEEVISSIERSGLYPAPFLVQDLTDKGFESNRLIDYATELAGGGIITRTDSKQTKGVLKKLLFSYKQKIGKLYKKQQSTNPLSQEDFDQRKKFFTDQYNAKVKHITEALQKRAEKPQTPQRTDFNAAAIKREDFK